jgi:hypothetical protein
MIDLTNHYEAFLEQLIRANVARENGEDRLTVSLNCLVNVIRLLEHDVRVREAGLTVPLHELAHALQDVLRGANPSLFSERPAGKRGAPTSTSFEGVRGVCTAAVSILTHGGDVRRAAAAFVAHELGRLGVLGADRKPIEAKKILHWHNEIGGRANARATNTHNSLLVKVDFASLDSAEKRRGFVTEILTGLVTAGF